MPTVRLARHCVWCPYPNPEPARRSAIPPQRRAPPPPRTARHSSHRQSARLQDPLEKPHSSDRVQELRVGLELVQRLDQSLHGFDRLERKQRAAELLDLLVLVLAEQLLFLAGARGLDVDGREDALLRQLAVEVD